MKLFLVSMLAFVAAWAIHVAVWRIRLPRRQTAALLVVYACCYVPAAAGVWMVAVSGSPLIATLHFTVFYVPASLAYASLYSLIEHDSPSLAIVASVAAAKGVGVTRAELEKEFGEGNIVLQRASAAAGNGLIVERGDDWELTPRGRILAKVFDAAVIFYRLDRAG